MASMVCFRQAQTLNSAGKGRKARLLTETSGMVVFAVCRRRYFPSRCERNLEPIDTKDFAMSACGS
jgi:hypothetical protein